MNFYTSKEIKPDGWLRRQLEIQAEGLSGNLHKIWPDIRDSAWIGGNRKSKYATNRLGTEIPVQKYCEENTEINCRNN